MAKNNKPQQGQSNEDKQDNFATVKITVKTHNDANGGHPHGIFDTIDKKHVSVGFTTDNKKGKNHGNIKLGVNPLKNRKKQSYMRRQGTVDNIKNYSNPRTGEMTEKDYEKAKDIAQKAKDKYLRKNGEKA